MNMRKFLLSFGVTYAAIAASVLLHALFYAFSLRLNTEAFGELQSTLAIIFLLTAGRSAAAGYVVMHAAGDEKNLGGVVQHAKRVTMLTALLIAGLFITCAPFLRDFLHLDSSLSFFLIGIAAIPELFSGMSDGILNVQRRFGVLALSAIFTPFLNVAFALLLLGDGLQDGDAGLIVLGSQCLSCINVLFVRWRPLQTSATFHPTHSSLRDVGELLLASLLFGASLRLDVFWAKHLLSASEAGSYAVAASIAVVLYFISSGTVRVVSVSLRNGPGAHVIVKSYGMIVAVSALLAGGFALFGDMMLRTMAGKTIPIDWSVLLPLFIALTLYSIITLDYTCLNIVQKRVHTGIGATLIIVQGAMLVLFGTDAQSIALSQCASMLILAVAFSILLLRAMRSLHGAPPSHPAEAHLLNT